MDFHNDKKSKLLLLIVNLLLAIIISTDCAAEDDPLQDNFLKSLTDQERQWLHSHENVSFTGDPNWLPYEAFDKNGNYIGIVAEHLSLIGKITGLKITMSPSQTWTESTEKAKQGVVDILSETDDSDLKSYLNFTSHYLSNPIVIAMRNTENYVEGIVAIKTQRIALIKDYGYAAKIRRKYSQIKFHTVNDIQDGLLSVSTGKVDALLCTLALCSYTIAEMGLKNVRITGKSEFDTKLAFGVQKDQSVLLSILNKAIASIQPAEQQKILNRWVGEKFVEKRDATLAIVIGIVGLILLIGILYWNRRLSNEVEIRLDSEKQQEYAANQLAKSTKHLLGIQRIAQVGSWEWHVATNLYTWSDEMFRIYDIAPEEFDGSESLIENAIHPDDRVIYKQSRANLMNTGEASSDEFRIQRKDGSISTVWTESKVVKDAQGKLIQMFGSVQDITDRKRTELALRESEALLEKAQEITHIGHWKLVPTSGESVASDELFRIFEVSREEANIAKFVDTVHPEDREKYITDLRRGALPGESWNIKHRLLFPNGDIKWVHAIGESITDDTGKVIELLGTVQDITESTLIREELERHWSELERLVSDRTKEFVLARDEAERANISKSEFLSRMSHELRTPLNAILGFSQMLDLDSAQMTELQRLNVNEIIDAGHHLLTLINEVLDLATIESGKFNISIEKIHLVEVLENSFSLVAMQMEKKNIELIKNMNKMNYYVNADPIRLKQVFVNLLTNAAKYNRVNGFITLECRLTENHRLRFCVTDTGAGLTQAQVDNLFTPFERFDAINHTEGTGIGLVITKHLIELMGGEIGVTSVAKQGSTFWIELVLSE